MFNPKMGYFIVYHSDNGFFSRQIEKKQRKAGFSVDHSYYVHVEISGGGASSINIAPPRSRLIDVTKVHKGRKARVMRYRDKAYTDKLRYKVAYFSASLCNMGYDIPGILSFIFKWIKHDNRLVFCSEGCAESLQRVFPSAFMNAAPSSIMPANFLDEESFEIVWEGII